MKKFILFWLGFCSLSAFADKNSDPYLETPDVEPVYGLKLQMNLTKDHEEDQYQSDGILSFEFKGRQADVEIGTDGHQIVQFKLNFHETEDFEVFSFLPANVERQDRFFSVFTGFGIKKTVTDGSNYLVTLGGFAGAGIVGDMDEETRVDGHYFENVFLSPVSGLVRVEFRLKSIEIQNETKIFLVASNNFSLSDSLSEPGMSNHLEVASEVTADAVCYFDARYFRMPYHHETLGIGHHSTQYVGGGCRTRF